MIRLLQLVIGRWYYVEEIVYGSPLRMGILLTRRDDTVAVWPAYDPKPDRTWQQQKRPNA